MFGNLSAEHFQNWLDKNYSNEQEKEQVKIEILDVIVNDPELTERGYTYNDLLRIARNEFGINRKQEFFKRRW